MVKLAAVARALNTGDRSLAAIALVQAELPVLASAIAARRVAEADSMMKTYDPDQPRDERGRWTAGGATGMKSTDGISPGKPSSSVQAGMKHPTSLSLSPDGLKFIATQEASKGPNLTAYLDQAGNPTIGYGHLLKPGEAFPNGITQEEASRFLAQDVSAAEQAVRRNVKVDLTPAQFDALVSFTYNEGASSLASSTLLHRLNSGDYAGAATEFANWDKVRVNHVLVSSPGLAGRRQRERDLFISGKYR